jgi:hypothetical protein
MNSKLFASLIALAAAAGAPAAFAHHAFNMYDNSNYTKVTGTVKTWDWKNPHVFMSLLTDDGVLWNVELSSPNIIGRKGWTFKSLGIGDKVPLTLHPMKDGTKYGLMVSVVTPAGKTLTDKD